MRQPTQYISNGISHRLEDYLSKFNLREGGLGLRERSCWTNKALKSLESFDELEQQ